jgi:hypothetical protein
MTAEALVRSGNELQTSLEKDDPLYFYRRASFRGQ